MSLSAEIQFKPGIFVMEGKKLKSHVFFSVRRKFVKNSRYDLNLLAFEYLKRERRFLNNANEIRGLVVSLSKCTVLLDPVKRRKIADLYPSFYFLLIFKPH